MRTATPFTFFFTLNQTFNNSSSKLNFQIFINAIFSAFLKSLLYVCSKLNQKFEIYFLTSKQCKQIKNKIILYQLTKRETRFWAPIFEPESVPLSEVSCLVGNDTSKRWSGDPG